MSKGGDAGFSNGLLVHAPRNSAAEAAGDTLFYLIVTVLAPIRLEDLTQIVPGFATPFFWNEYVLRFEL